MGGGENIGKFVKMPSIIFYLVKVKAFEVFRITYHIYSPQKVQKRMLYA